MGKLTSNREIEDAAISWVMAQEREAGRTPVDTRQDRHAKGDIESAPRVIEVKAFGRSARGAGLWLELPQVDEARRNPDFFLYVVENVRQGDPAAFTLRVLSGERLQQLLARAKERRYYEVPWPVAHYSDTPEGLT